MRQKKSHIRKSLVAIFAHPDDEAFGPAGTLAKFSKDWDVYLLCATKGEAGGSDKNLAEVREGELKRSAKILGIKKVFFLGFRDGHLSNATYHELAKKIEDKITELKPQILMTTEPKGVSGHLDHIAVSFVTTFVFTRTNIAKKLYYYCITKEKRGKAVDSYFIYFPPGYNREDVDLIVNVKDQWLTKVKAMMEHKSQKDDAKRVLASQEKLPKEEHFFVLEK